MKIVLEIACLLVVIQYSSALICPTTPVYNTSIAVICDELDIKVLWPNYENVNQYYRCQGAGNPILVNCFPNTIFDFSKQRCTKCEDYIPAPTCQALKGKACTTFKPITTAAPIPTSVPLCNGLDTYDLYFIPACVKNDIYMIWPNYRNASQYYWCQGFYNPKLESCNGGTYFNYYAQSCTNCHSYVAAPACNKLPFDKSNKCYKM